MDSDKGSEDSAKDLIQELKEENHVHPNILLPSSHCIYYWFNLCIYLHCNEQKNICPYVLYKRR